MTTQTLTISLTPDELRAEVARLAELGGQAAPTVPGGMTFTVTFDGLDPAAAASSLLAKSTGPIPGLVFAELGKRAMDQLIEAGHMTRAQAAAAGMKALFCSALGPELAERLDAHEAGTCGCDKNNH